MKTAFTYQQLLRAYGASLHFFAWSQGWYKRPPLATTKAIRANRTNRRKRRA